jgi:hypothetical protein
MNSRGIPNKKMVRISQTQTEEWADDEHLPTFGTRARTYGLNEEEAADIAAIAEEAARAEQEEIRERGIRHFLHGTCDNSSTPVTDDEDNGDTGGAILVKPEMTMVDDEPELPEPPKEPGFELQVGHVGVVHLPESMAPSPWSSTWAQARAEAAQRQADDERFS